jgi:hypothetical protein
MAGIPTALTADIPTVSAASTATQVLAWFNAECAALNTSLKDDWLAAGCPDGTGEGCYASPASNARFESLFEHVQTWLDAALWRATMDHIAGRTPDLPEDLRALWEVYEPQFRIMRSLVAYTNRGYAHEILVHKHGRFAERMAARAAIAAALAPEPEPESYDSDDEPVSCGRNCGDCGNGPFGCGLTRGDFRDHRVGGGAGSEPEEPHPMDGPQSFQAITASCTACGGTAEYSAGLLWVPAESFEVLKQVGMVALAIHDSISPWHRHIYSNLRWMARAPDPEKPGKSFDGLYLINTHVAGVGYKPHPVASDGEYSLGLVSHHNMQSWTFKVTTVVEGTPEYERYCSLTSVWAHLNIDIPHTPCVSDEDYAAYRKRVADEYEAKYRAAAAARYAKRVALYGTYEECPGGPDEYESRDRMAYHSDRVDREECY